MTDWSCRRIYKPCRSLYVIETSKEDLRRPHPSLEMNVHPDSAEEGEGMIFSGVPTAKLPVLLEIPSQLTLTQAILIKLRGP